ncbi:MAG: hypothetical protein IT513_12400 [Burkholderiales bacterium]|nr:hypothetical protein [Burkholderiales bacterium]
MRLLLLATLLLLAGACHSQAYAGKSLPWVAPFPPGGPTSPETCERIRAQSLDLW